MLAYVLDAWASTADGGRGRPAGRRLSRRPWRRSSTSSPTGPCSPSRTSRAGPATRSRSALAVVAAEADEILVLSGDVPLVTGADLEAVLEARRQDDAAIALASVFAADPAELGRVVRGEFGTVERIVEARDADARGARQQRGQRRDLRLRRGLAAPPDRGARRPSAATGELYLTDLVRLAREDGRLVSAVAFEDDGRFDGINDRSQLAAAEWSLRVRLNEAHMRDGVTMRDPSTVYLDWTVDLGAGRHPRAERRPARRDDGRRRAASSARAASSSTRRSARGRADLGQRRRILDRRGRRDDRAVQPPPPGQRRRARAPRSATSRSSRTRASAPGSKQHHMSYLGDAEIGEGVNIGAGTITANYDGTRKHRDDHRRRRVHRRRHDARRPARDRRRGADRAPAPSSPGTCPPASSRSACPARIREPRAKPRRSGGAGDARWTPSSRSSSSSS